MKTSMQVWSWLVVQKEHHHIYWKQSEETQEKCCKIMLQEFMHWHERMGYWTNCGIVKK